MKKVDENKLRALEELKAHKMGMFIHFNSATFQYANQNGRIDDNVVRIFKEIGYMRTQKHN